MKTEKDRNQTEVSLVSSKKHFAQLCRAKGISKEKSHCALGDHITVLAFFSTTKHNKAHPQPQLRSGGTP